ncbi:amidohydrolase family protein [Streptomyces sp. A7024]|uniref:Amidohydrolase family protein n=1 Tax=Streptomyces coryli TaxID=1128680 RepID=A0A6G4TV55_9ACTN|nr:amidohydrolase family protein [Streptomyces coryli]
MSEAWRVDAHHHLWDLSIRHQPWLDAPALAPIRRSYGPDDLAPLLRATGVGRTVLVQTQPAPEETAELLAHAAAPGPIAGVVGWTDLASPAVTEHLTALRELPGGAALVGIRHPVQAEPDPDWLTRPAVLRGLRATGTANLAFDLLVRPWQLPTAVAAVRACPGTTFVLNHLGQPPADDAEAHRAWARSLRQLADAGPRVFCKLSGLLTTPGRDVRTCTDTALEIFGPRRLLFGSDWPVCLLTASYGRVLEVTEQLCAGLSPQDRSEIFANAACRAYRMPVGPGWPVSRSGRRG